MSPLWTFPLGGWVGGEYQNDFILICSPCAPCDDADNDVLIDFDYEDGNDDEEEEDGDGDCPKL